MPALYRCCLCGNCNAEEGRWQHWFVNPEFAITIPRGNLPETHWLDNEICYINHETYADPHSGRPKTRYLIWFYICHRCLDDLLRLLHPSSIVTTTPPSDDPEEGLWTQSIDLDLTPMGYRCVRCGKFKDNGDNWQIWINYDITKYKHKDSKKLPPPFNRGYREWVDDKLYIWLFCCQDCANVIHSTNAE